MNERLSKLAELGDDEAKLQIDNELARQNVRGERPFWAVVELNGRKTVMGRCEYVKIMGVPMLEILVMLNSTIAQAKFFSPASVYGMTPMDEESIRLKVSDPKVIDWGDDDDETQRMWDDAQAQDFEEAERIAEGLDEDYQRAGDIQF